MNTVEAKFIDDDYHSGRLVATGSYYPGSRSYDRLQPDDPEEIEIESILWTPYDGIKREYLPDKTVDISELLENIAPDYFCQLEQNLFEDGKRKAIYYEEKAIDDYYEAKKEERLWKKLKQ